MSEEARCQFSDLHPSWRAKLISDLATAFFSRGFHRCFLKANPPSASFLIYSHISRWWCFAASPVWSCGPSANRNTSWFLTWFRGGVLHIIIGLYQAASCLSGYQPQHQWFLDYQLSPHLLEGECRCPFQTF